MANPYNSQPSTARSRAPSGKTNMVNSSRSNISATPRSSARSTARSNDEGTDFTVTSSLKQVLSDPLNVFRPFSAERREYDAHLRNPPMLPKSRFPTVPSARSPPRAYRPLTCPKNFIEENQRENPFEKSAIHTRITESDRKNFCNEFVERNKDRLWRYDLNYLKKTPRTVYNELSNDENFVAKAKKIYSQERCYKVSNSDNSASCLTSNIVDAKPLAPDPFISSLTTTRDAREVNVRNALSPALMQHGTKHFRGYLHAEDFGNFSRYNQALKQNAGTSINR